MHVCTLIICVSEGLILSFKDMWKNVEENVPYFCDYKAHLSLKFP